MPGGKREYCKTHKKECMVNVNIKLCIDPECPHHALYGNEDVTKEYCKTHKKEGMVDRVHKKCKTCNKHLALYGPVGEKATYCYEHSADDMVDLIFPHLNHLSNNALEEFNEVNYWKIKIDPNIDISKLI